MQVKLPFEKLLKVGYHPIFTQILTKSVIFAETHLQIFKVILLVTNHYVKGCYTVLP